MVELEWILYFLFLGCFVGFVAGLLGVGGGGILVPVLTSMFLSLGVPVDNVVHLALGTSMACIITTSISSSRAHNKKRAVNWQIVKIMSCGIVLGTFLSTYVAAYLDSIYLAIFFSLFMCFTATKMLKTHKSYQTRDNLTKKNMLVSSTGIGAVSALVSIGGGSLTVPYLVSNNIGIKQAIGTSAAIGFPLSLAGTFGYLIYGWNNERLMFNSIGFVYVPAVFLISITSFIVAPYGVRASHKLPVNTLKKLFAFLLVILSLKMLIIVI